MITNSNFRNLVKIHTHYMNIAIEESKLSMNANQDTTVPKLYIGAVLINHTGQILGKAHKEEDGLRRLHSEYQLLKSLPDGINQNLILYTTLEPCNFRHAINNSLPNCTDLIIQKGIGYLVIATIDPHPHIQGSAISKLTSEGINILLMEGKSQYNKLIQKIKLQNREFYSFNWLEN